MAGLHVFPVARTRVNQFSVAIRPTVPQAGMTLRLQVVSMGALGDPDRRSPRLDFPAMLL
jgi:hypothetical protein